jgi:hypothetical protein
LVYCLRSYQIGRVLDTIVLLPAQRLIYTGFALVLVTATLVYYL